MRSLALALFIALATLGLTHRANAIPVVAAEYDALGNIGFSVGEPFFAGQTFLATESGTVLDVSILASGTNDLVDPAFVTIALAETSAGLPGAILDSVTVLNPILSFLSASLFTVDFSSVNIDLVAGTSYALIVSSDNNVGIGLNGDILGSYADGSPLHSSVSPGLNQGFFVFAFPSWIHIRKRPERRIQLLGVTAPFIRQPTHSSGAPGG